MKSSDRQSIELLAPAKNAAGAIAAIRCGADAVYMGAPRFGAREAAGNPIDEIRRVAEFAHPYHARIYAAVNTLLRDDELAVAAEMIEELTIAGIDGLIIQDVGLIGLVPKGLPLIASTQMHNATPEKVRFLEEVGFSRVILARELTLEQIRRIREQTTIELECFVHGALCVCESGRCTMSQALGGRSGNRGQCAQPCRRRYHVRDAQGRQLAEGYLLSLKDLNLSDRLESLIDAGVTSFKIEGRLKEAAYAANVTGFYRQQLDTILERRMLSRSSSGRVKLHFVPNLAKGFNRGFTEYGLDGKRTEFGANATPKSIGEFIGAVEKLGKGRFTLDRDADLHNGDGLCFFDSNGELSGTTVNGVEGRTILPRSMEGILAGTEIRRNYDHEFVRQVEKDPAERKIPITIHLRDTADGLELSAVDEDGLEAVITTPVEKQLAKNAEAAKKTIETQLSRLGNTIFEPAGIYIETTEAYFIPASTLNEMRRSLVERLMEVRENNRPRMNPGEIRETAAYPDKNLDFRGHVLNKRAVAFFRRHGVETIEPAAESGVDLRGKVVMTTKYCLREELGLCPGRSRTTQTEPLILIDENDNEFEVQFRCGQCRMEIRLV